LSNLKNDIQEIKNLLHKLLKWILIKFV
jgi:hypothetical protein